MICWFWSIRICTFKFNLIVCWFLMVNSSLLLFLFIGMCLCILTTLFCFAVNSLSVYLKKYSVILSSYRVPVCRPLFVFVCLLFLREWFVCGFVNFYFFLRMCCDQCVKPYASTIFSIFKCVTIPSAFFSFFFLSFVFFKII